jgi:hypothetical protein
MTLSEGISLAVSVVSLIVSVVALIVAKRLTKASLLFPYVMEELAGLLSYFETRELPLNPVQDLSRLREDIAQIKRRAFILNHIGYSDRLEKVKALMADYEECHERMKALGDGITEANAAEFMEKLKKVDIYIQNILSSISPMIVAQLQDPFKHM